MKYFLILILPLLSSCVLANSLNQDLFKEDMQNKNINFSELTLKQKINQLVIAKPNKIDDKWVDLELGGIFINNLETSQDYKEFISYYQDNSKIDLFVATDMEGYWNPFNFYKSKNFGEISNFSEAYNLGKEHGKILKELGFNLDFSPIVETRNKVWPGRSFTGNNSEVKEKISGYLKGLKDQEIKSTAKHYPGGSMVKNPHVLKYKTEIFKEDLDYFNYSIEQGVDAIMVGHPVVFGVVDSKGKQATVSKEIIQPLRDNFKGLIITDAVTMLGLRISYFWNFKKVYPDLILAGNDIILDTHKNANCKKIKKRTEYLEKEALKSKELLKRINESSRKVLEAKGYILSY